MLNPAVLAMQAQVAGPPPEDARNAAERTLTALTEQNQRLAEEKDAAEAAARDAKVGRCASCSSSERWFRVRHQVHGAEPRLAEEEDAAKAGDARVAAASHQRVNVSR